MTDKEEEVLKVIHTLKDKRFEISHRTIARATGFSRVTVGKVFKLLIEKDLLRRVRGEWLARTRVSDLGSLKERNEWYIARGQRENEARDPERKARVAERRRRGQQEKQKDTFIPFGPKGPVYKASPPPDAPFEDFLR